MWAGVVKTFAAVIFFPGNIIYSTCIMGFGTGIGHRGFIIKSVNHLFRSLINKIHLSIDHGNQHWMLVGYPKTGK